MKFIEKLLSELKKRNISKSELARSTEIGDSTIRSWEKGSQPTLDKLIKIADYLDLTLDELCCYNAKNRKIEIHNAYDAADPGSTYLENKRMQPPTVFTRVESVYEKGI